MVENKQCYDASLPLAGMELDSEFYSNLPSLIRIKKKIKNSATSVNVYNKEGENRLAYSFLTNINFKLAVKLNTNKANSFNF